jgi:hypothetical protein
LQLIALVLISFVQSVRAIVWHDLRISSAIKRLAGARRRPRRSPSAANGGDFSVAYPLSYGVGSLITGSAIDIAGYIGMFLLLAAIQAAGLFFACTKASDLATAAR